MASFSQGEASILKYEDKVPPYSMIGSAEEADSLQRFNRALQKSQVFPWLCAGMGGLGYSSETPCHSPDYI